MKKSFLVPGLILVLTSNFLVASDSFSWNKIKKEIKSNNVVPSKKEQSIEKSNQTKEYVKSQYGLNVNKKSAAQIQYEKINKNIEIGMLYRPMNSSEKTEESIVTNPDGTNSIQTTTTSVSKGNFGIFINGKLDLSSLGFNMQNLYASTEIYQDSVDIGLLKRFYLMNDNPYTTEGLYAEGGAGVSYQTKSTDKETGTIDLYGKLGVGYNYENYNVNVAYKQYMESNTDKNGLFQIGAGYRF